MEYVYDVLIGIASGVASGFFVYLITKRREEDRMTYQFWMQYLFKVLEECEMYIPYGDLNHISKVGKPGTEWHKAITAIIDDINPYGHEDKDFDEREIRISDNVLIALRELQKWRYRKCILKRKKCQDKKCAVSTAKKDGLEK